MAEAGRVELVIFRGSQRVWEGPVTHITYEGDKVVIQGRDITHYINRTIMRGEYNNRHPNTVTVLKRLERILNVELARKEALDPPANVLPHIRYVAAKGSVTYPARYYDISPIRRGVAAARNVDQMEAAFDSMQGSYGLSLDIGLPPGNTAYGLTWATAQYQDWQLRQYMIASAEALSRYPAAFIKAANIEGIYFVRELVGTTNFNIGGAAVDTRLYLDIVDYPKDDVPFGAEHTIHHELAHLIHNAFGAALIETRWKELNPSGFTYGAGWDAQNFTGRPAGFLRDYSRYSFAEDLADVAGAVMSSATRSTLAAASSADSVVAGKVALYKEWMAAISGGLVSGNQYYEALHEGTIVTPGENGVTDARTTAHTLPYEMTVFNHMDTYAARGGLDYTVVGRSLILFDVHQRLGQTAPVTGADFIGDPVITQYGMELATYVAMTDGKGHWGSAGGVDDYYGEWEMLHQAYDEDAQAQGQEPPSTAELRSQAARTYAQGKRPPLVVRVPDNSRLNPDGVLSVDDLVPGVWIPLSASLPGRSLSQMQKLDNMTVEESESEGEVIKVTLSPAPIEQEFVDEETSA